MPRSGEPHPEFPGCFWSPTINTYACDDGFTVDGAELPPGLLGTITGGNYQPPQTTSGASNVTITEAGEVTAAQLSGLIRQGGGHFDAAASDPLVGLARSQWWNYSVQLSNNGQTARITETNYLLYGGLALIGLIVITMATR